MITDKNDMRAKNPYLFKRTNPNPKEMWEELVHVAGRVYSKSKKKWGDGFKTLRCGKKREAIIRDMSLNAIDVSQQTKIPVYEVVALRGMYGLVPKSPPQPEPTVEECKSDYLKMMEDIYSSYETTPIGAKGPIHQESYLAPNKDDNRLIEVRYRNINNYGNRY